MVLKCRYCLKVGEHTVRADGKPRNWCKACQRAYSKRHYLANKSKHNVRRRANSRANRNAAVARIREAKQRPCTDCGNEYPYYVMDFDHVGEDKLMNIAKMAGLSWARIEAEIAKCEVVCSNCHRIRTWQRLHNGM
jgi:hypothetical protein